MLDEDLFFASIARIGRLYRTGELSPVELVTALLERIDRLDPALNSYITVAHERALRDAAHAERLLRAPGAPPLAGIPITLKDNIATAGIRTTAGSPILRDWVPDTDAECVASLGSVGAVVIGKSNMFEFAFGEASELFGHVRNPWDHARTTAGSSTGSVAAVAAGLAFGAIATDTGGSIRVPAAFCGVVGLKPTYGRVPYAGIVETTSRTMAHAGPVGRSAADTAAVFDAVAGEDTSGGLDRPVRGARLAVARRQPDESIDPAVESALDEAARVFERLGVGLVAVEVEDLLPARAALWAISSAEAAEIHRDWLATRADEYHPVVRARIERGKGVTGADYVRAQRVRRWIADRLDGKLAGTVGLLLPIAPITAYELGARYADVGGQMQEVSQAVTRYTPLASVTGRPSIAIPCGFAGELPIGMQLVGHPGEESVLLRLGNAFQSATDWHARRPAGLSERVG